jgi:hypothetical protein
MRIIPQGAATALTIALGLTSAQAQDLTGTLNGTLDTLGASFPAGEAAGFAQALAEAPAGVSGDTFGHLLYTRRHFDKAAWFFGADAVADPSDPVSLNNFAALVTELHAAGDAPADWIEAARMAALAATEMAPDMAAFHNTLANAERAAGNAAAAVAAATRATELAPDEPLFWSNLARALDAAGDSAGAGAALARAHALEPNGMALLTAVGNLPASQGSYQSNIGPTCNVNFRCQEICPKSIIGGIQSVTCEIENSSAQMACQEGKPYPTSYDCSEDFPEYGIMIPGLNAGFSIGVPGFSAHVKVNGDGSVDVRVEAGPSIGPVTPYVRGDGHWSPSGGASFDNFGGGVRVNVLPGGGGAAGDLASGLGHPPAHIELEQVGDGPAQVNLETYNAGVLSF